MMVSNCSWESSWRSRPLGVRPMEVLLLLELGTIGDRDVERDCLEDFVILNGVSFARGVRLLGSGTSVSLSDS